MQPFPRWVPFVSFPVPTEALTSQCWYQKAAKWQCLKLCAFHVCTDRTCLWPGLSSTAPVYVRASVHTLTQSRSIPGSPEPALPLPDGELALQVWLCFPAFSHLTLPLPWGSQSVGTSSPAGIASPLLLLARVQWVWASSCAPGREAGRYRGYSLTIFGVQSRLPTPSPYRPNLPPWMATVAQSECLLLPSRALHGLLGQQCQEDSSEHCGRWQCWLQHLAAQKQVVVHWQAQPFRNCCRMACRGTTAPLPHLQGYHSPAPPEPAPAAEAAARTLLLCLTSPPGCGGHAGSSLGSSVSVPQEAGGDGWLGPLFFSVHAGCE